ncbi:hypothetical protein LEM8419_01558 [Neolewinella maritima]|uniref:Uncharacterized protein n=1 Tax=Neolewinella maritima TaxID=1383882 RepID=A0ABM9AZZ3_9BACT|nr:hypothetical protein [Neolewinella maritima]CAH1000405.1 hypothetical protein LEM8419_01558 [Neolewinella maritima]
MRCSISSILPTAAAFFVLLCVAPLAGQSAPTSDLASNLSLAAFKINRNGSSHLVIEWYTVREVDNDHFLVERSEDGQQFKVVGKVTGHGTTRRGYEYNYFDYVASEATVYYRLTQVDFSGSLHRSRVQVVPGSRVELLPLVELTADSLVSHRVVLLY